MNHNQVMSQDGAHRGRHLYVLPRNCHYLSFIFVCLFWGFFIFECTRFISTDYI